MRSIRRDAIQLRNTLPFPENDFEPAALRVLDDHFNDLVVMLHAEDGLLEGHTDHASVLVAIAAHWRERDASPTLRDLSAESGLRVGTVRRHVRTLQRRRILACWEPWPGEVLYSVGPRLARLLCALVESLDPKESNAHADVMRAAA